MKLALKKVGISGMVLADLDSLNLPVVEYADFLVRVTSKYDEYLDAYFGKWKEYPPLSERESELVRTFIIRPLKQC